MNGQIVSKDNIQATPPFWQHPILPAPAVQGSILLTVNDFITPPQDSSNFRFIPMEQIIGTADVKMIYDEVSNTFNFYKASGHLNNNGEWNYNWTKFATVVGISEETQQALRELIYVSYRYDTTIPNTLKVYAIKKDGTEDLLCDISFVSAAEFNTAITAINQRIDNIEQNPVVAGTAIDIQTTLSGKQVNVKYGAGQKVNTDNELQPDTDNDTIILDNNNKLRADLIDDTLTNSLIKTYSIDKIINIIKNKLDYKGEVASYADLPADAIKGSVYKVVDEKNLYVQVSVTTTANYIPFIEIAEAFTAYAIELHKSNTGLYAKLRYDTIDFTIDNLYNLKSQLIDDSIDGSDPNANRKTYSILKILNLLSSAMVYKGQVATYADLPSGLTTDNAGWTYNVFDTGDNYAWNGTSWDNLSGEYIAGAGIVINGKTISATGISFIVGDGLQASGSGSTTTLSTRITDGLERVNVGTTAAPVFADGVKAGSAIAVNANGVNVKTGYTTKTDTNTGNLEVNYNEGLGLNTSQQLKVNIDKGLEIDTNNNINVKNGKGISLENNEVNINTNFTEVATPLGTQNSNINRHSDGKISIALGEALSGDYIFEKSTFAVGVWYNLPNGKNINDYTWLQIGRLNAAQFFQNKDSGTVQFGVAIAGGSGGYLGVLCMNIEIDKTNNRIRLVQWGQYTTGSTVTYTNQTGNLNMIDIVGIK